MSKSAIRKNDAREAVRLSLSVQYASEAQNLPARAQWRRWISAALERSVTVALRIVDEEEGRHLNRTFRGKDYATNVLTFVYDEAGPLSGDVVICAPVVEKEAREASRDLMAHYAHLAVHAALHLQGFEHETDEEAHEMESRETAILAKLGYADPYQG